MLRIDRLAFLDWSSVSFEVTAGETLAVLGPSGSGKSLLLRAIADLIPHDGGCSLHGNEWNSISPTDWRRRVSYLSAEALWWEDLVGDHFTNAPSAEALRNLGLDGECSNWEVSRLSTGERQRLGILRQLDREPEALLLDEPTSNLDEKSAEAVESLLREYISNRNACAIWVTHDRQQANRVAGRVFEMKDKKLQVLPND